MKKIFSIALVLVMALSLSIPAMAAESSTDDIATQVQQIADTYGFQTHDLSPETTEVIAFSSIDEFEQFAQNITSQPNNYSAEIAVSPVQAHDMNDSHVINWWAPFSGWGMTGVACWRNVSLEYSYKYVNDAPQFTSCSNIDSYLTGINVTSWDQKASSYNFTTSVTKNDKVEITVKGNFVLGIALDGYTIGLTIPDEWDASLRLYKA